MDLVSIANSRHLWEPTIVRPSHWSGNTPFVRWLVSQIKPETFVELGTEHGHSYFNIVESILSFRQDAKCFAIDTWEGDEFTGKYDESVYHDVNMLNESLFKNQSTLLRTTFDAALLDFEDESIDLLHIDGSHRYEDVLRDFSGWKFKVRKNGFIIYYRIIFELFAVQKVITLN